MDQHAQNGSRNAGVPRKKWSPAEDKLLRALVRKYGTANWRIISNHIRGREGKQCRERWLNHLSPDVKKGHLTDGEWAIVLRAHETFGNRWSDIAKMLPGRTPNQIKNFWHSSQRVELEQSLKDRLEGLSLPSGPVPGAIIAPRFREQLEGKKGGRGMKRGRGEEEEETRVSKKTRVGRVSDDDEEEVDGASSSDEDDDLNLLNAMKAFEAERALDDASIKERRKYASTTNTEEIKEEEEILESPLSPPSLPQGPFPPLSSPLPPPPPPPLDPSINGLNLLSVLAAELLADEFSQSTHPPPPPPPPTIPQLLTSSSTAPSSPPHV